MKMILSECQQLTKIKFKISRFERALSKEGRWSLDIVKVSLHGSITERTIGFLSLSSAILLKQTLISVSDGGSIIQIDEEMLGLGVDAP